MVTLLAVLTLAMASLSVEKAVAQQDSRSTYQCEAFISRRLAAWSRRPGKPGRVARQAEPSYVSSNASTGTDVAAASLNGSIEHQDFPRGPPTVELNSTASISGAPSIWALSL